MSNTKYLDLLAHAPLDQLTPKEIGRLDAEFYELTGESIGLTYENFSDFELAIYQPGQKDSVTRVRWPIPALRTVREVRELAERMYKATIKPE